MNIFTKNSVFIKNAGNKILENYQIRLSRKKAIKYTKEIRKFKGKKYVDSGVLNEIKRYAKNELGSVSFWPWLVLYSEIRERFIPGWIPQDYYRFVLLKKYNTELGILISESKTLDHQFFPEFAFKPLFNQISGNLYSPEGQLQSELEVKNLLKKYNAELVIKESYGWQGKQVTFLHSNEFRFDKLQKNKSYTVQPVIKQHEELEKIHPSSVNTIRVNTYLEENGTPVLLNALLRFGIDGSRVDNSSSGGNICFIGGDGKCEKWSYDYYSSKKDTHHPDTNVEFGKIKIPNYSLLLHKCLDSHKKFPYARIIGWDVVISLDGEPVLLEWNTNVPSLWKSEAIKGPLWDKIPG